MNSQVSGYCSHAIVSCAYYNIKICTFSIKAFHENSLRLTHDVNLIVTIIHNVLVVCEWIIELCKWMSQSETGIWCKIRACCSSCDSIMINENWWK